MTKKTTTKCLMNVTVRKDIDSSLDDLLMDAAEQILEGITIYSTDDAIVVAGVLEELDGILGRGIFYYGYFSVKENTLNVAFSKSEEEYVEFVNTSKKLTEKASVPTKMLN